MGFINVSKEKKDTIITGKIDKFNYLGIESDRTSLVPLGVAFGINMPEKIEDAYTSLMRSEQVNSNSELKALLACAAIQRMKDSDDINIVLSEDNMLKNADEMLNRGLDVIGEQIDTFPAENMQNKMIELMDEAYEKNIKQ